MVLSDTTTSAPEPDADTSDPDALLQIPLRETAALISTLDALIIALDAAPAAAAALGEALPSLGEPGVAQLPEVGRVTDAEGLRLQLHRLHARLNERMPTPEPVPAPPPVTQPSNTQIPTRKASRSAAVVNDELADAFVWWDDITDADVDGYLAVLEAAENERPLQRHLAANPHLLVQHLRGGGGRWVLSQKRLGSEYVTDFVVGERDSGGFSWTFVELQSPRAAQYVPSSGRMSEQFDEGIRQILDWRRWLRDNLDYAQRPRVRNGLGLENVSPQGRGLLLIGRADDLNDDDRERRRQLTEEHNIDIHTYDWVVREAAARIRELAARRS